ncbi:MAG: ankyrin repeat domain-containing protein [Alphaproteobacteria bacterium]|nr:ankyrin repeat domain-containing protein [Alphaproteobacteria bacterium]
MKREIVLDTETTGLSAENGDKLVAIGAVELIDGKQTGKTFYAEINPLRPVPQDVVRIHGLTDEKLKDKPTFPQIAPSFLDFIGASPLVIHNAPFDMAFLNAELTMAGFAPIAEERIVNTLPIAKRLRIGSSVSPDALYSSVFKRIDISSKKRPLPNALLGAQLLAGVYVYLREKEFEKSLKTGKFDDIKRLYEDEAHIYTNLATVLTIAAYFKRWDIFKWLIDEKGVDVNARNDRGETPLMMAANEGNLDICKWLVNEKGADINARNDDGETPLMYANCFQIVTFLVEAGANVNEENEEGKTALNYAIYGNNFDTFRYLVEHGADIRRKWWILRDTLVLSNTKNCNKMANMLLDLGVDINADFGWDTTIMQACYEEGHEEILQRLIALGAKDIVGGITAAVETGHPEYLDILLPLVPDVNNLIDRKGKPVDLLSISPRKYITSYLIAHGVRPKNETDETK